MRSVLVTGGSRGIGLGIVRQLSASGYRVIAVARNSSNDLQQLTASQEGSTEVVVHFRPFDLSDIGSLSELVASIRHEFGPIFGLVNNAGSGTSGVLANMRDAQIEALVRLNVLSPLTLTRHVVRSMLAKGSGRIVNISSVVATTGYSGLSVYSATKAALIGFTRSLAREVGATGITVNAVSPGFVDTDMTSLLDKDQRDKLVRRSALRRLPEVSDVATAVDFLLSDKARNMTGTVMTVDAGATA
jgi:3-oxoacyl-[acyl-carrier protein] reductase